MITKPAIAEFDNWFLVFGLFNIIVLSESSAILRVIVSNGFSLKVPVAKFKFEFKYSE